ncbi:ribosome biogenesis GTP-binding protein YihA/YsxC [Desulfovibrio legallii]|jgi:GTP-binding protein|uniref:Probable GTP-binding protein EngB n=1 Tax=Desulfovibrio legallii TaxID=571438 RepID=A0A1G7QTB7_9BACT|nr:ribosome biogenesis GTP-binding protein YihA/YsxC [Desulfovibrio legallii]SDG01119.1 GTP-binding protein [Desulfovibrio legallii]
MRPTLALEATVYTPAQLMDRPEAQIALAGRSNVGKSSLLNALAGRRKLAKVSATPGKTRSINFYRVEPAGFYLVDLPGYGYARASHAEREKWARLMEKYFLGCRALRALALLLDCRLPPQQLDKNLVDFARVHGLPLLPVLTKADKCSQRERAARQKEWELLLPRRPLLTAAATGLGLDELWRGLAAAAGATDPAEAAATAAEAAQENALT